MSDKVKQLTDATFEQEALKSEMPVLVDFWADWCGPCRMMGPVIDKLADEFEGKLKVCKVNVDQNPALSAQYGIMSIPMFMVIKGGQPADKIVGARSPADMKHWVEQHV